MSQPARDEASAVTRLDSRRAAKSDWRPWARSLAEHYPELEPAALHIAKHLSLYADVQGYCYPSHAILRAETGYSRRTVTAALGELREANVIRQAEGSGTGRRRAEFWLLPHVRVEVSSTQGGNDTATQGRTPRARVEGSSSEDPGRPPQPPDGGRRDRRRWTCPPPPPKRERERPRWLAEIRSRAVEAELPLDHLDLIAAAVEMQRADDRASVAAFLERFSSWRDAPAGDAPREIEQMSIFDPGASTR